MKAIVLSALVPVCLLFGCGDEEEAEENLGTAPVLSDLMIEGDPMGMVGEMLTIGGSMTVMDAEGDINDLLLEVVLPDGTSQSLPTNDVMVPAGATAVSIQIAMVIRPPAAGSYRVNLRMNDLKGNVSAPIGFDLPVQ